MSSTITPNMSLIVPGVGTEAGPQYANDINNSLTIIDQHDHSSGNGVQITPSGLNINSDLTIGSNNLIALRSVRFTAQGAPLGLAADLGCLYESGVDLYYNDGSGNQIRITQGGAVSGASGTITGLPSGTASAAYAAGTFVFQSATNTAANIDGGSFILRNSTASSNGLTLQPPNAMASSYTITLPSIPAQTNVLTIDTSGNINSITYNAVGQGMTSTGANSIAAARTRSSGVTVGTGGVGISAAINQSTTSTVVIPVTSSSVTITTSGRPVFLGMIPVSGAGAFVQVNSSGSYTSSAYIHFLRGTTDIGAGGLITLDSASVGQIQVPPGTFTCIDTPGAGTYTYSLTFQAPTCASPFINIVACALLVYEL